MPVDGPTWAVSPHEWGARRDYDAWTDVYTPDDGVALHHGGSTNYAAGNPPFSEGAEMQQLRRWEDYHIGRGWRGLAYGWGVGQTGRVYRIRGWSTYGAHTGDVDGDGIANNAEIIPIIFVGSGNHHELSSAAQASIVRLRLFLEEESGRKLRLYGHQELRGTVTSCPGPKLMDYVIENREVEDMPTAEEIADAVWERRVHSGITAALALDRTYRNVEEVTLAHRASTLGTTAFADLTDEDVDAIAEAVADEQARRLAD